ncbi:MAG: sulfatase-like hydrolase/transferase [Phycisphaerales bacterium]|nr:MAG: sulfatase-like hydrolase/transferase [Phycisphaerales bacterium]
MTFVRGCGFRQLPAGLRVWSGFLLVLPAGLGCERFLPDNGLGPSAGGERPNVIFILTDDQAPNTLGIEGNPIIRTPELDRLAGEGAYFSRAYVPIPQCAPSRAAILTGLYPHQNGVLRNEDASLRPDAVTFSRLFKQNGYACGLVGKWHLGKEDLPQAGFEDLWVTLPLPGEYHDPQLWVNKRLVQTEGYLTDILTDHAISFVEKHVDRAFLLWLAYKAPHVPARAPPDPAFAYDAADMVLPPSSADDLSAKPAAQRDSNGHALYREVGEDEIRRRLSLYYARISSIDHNVGRLVDRLKELGLDERTLIIFMSDNGVLYGEHQLLRKGAFFYEEVVRSPLIMCWPGRIEPGTRIDALVSSLDLFPTLCAAVDIPTPEGLAGKELWPLLQSRVSSVHDALFFEYEATEKPVTMVPVRGLVTARHKYTKYLEDGEELYDLQVDVHEMRNLIDDPGSRELADRLRAELGAWRTRMGDLQ